MIRVVEILLFVLPLLAFVGWRVWAPGRVPPRSAIVGAAVVLALMFAVLVWLRQQEAAPPDAVYVPMRLENGQIVPASPILPASKMP